MHSGVPVAGEPCGVQGVEGAGGVGAQPVPAGRRERAQRARDRKPFGSA
jgi:hypothetical protein